MPLVYRVLYRLYVVPFVPSHCVSLLGGYIYANRNNSPSDSHTIDAILLNVDPVSRLLNGAIAIGLHHRVVCIHARLTVLIVSCESACRHIEEVISLIFLIWTGVVIHTHALPYMRLSLTTAACLSLYYAELRQMPDLEPLRRKFGVYYAGRYICWVANRPL